MSFFNFLRKKNTEYSVFDPRSNAYSSDQRYEVKYNYGGKTITGTIAPGYDSRGFYLIKDPDYIYVDGKTVTLKAIQPTTNQYSRSIAPTRLPSKQYCETGELPEGEFDHNVHSLGKTFEERCPYGYIENNIGGKRYSRKSKKSSRKSRKSKRR